MTRRRDSLKLAATASGGLLIGFYLLGIGQEAQAVETLAPNDGRVFRERGGGDSHPGGDPASALKDAEKAWSPGVRECCQVAADYRRGHARVGPPPTEKKTWWKDWGLLGVLAVLAMIAAIPVLVTVWIVSAVRASRRAKRALSSQVQAGAGIWAPQPSVTDHLRGQLAPDLDFFVQPPQEIGEVVSAYTSLKRGVEAKSAGARIATVGVAAAAGVAAGAGLDYQTGLSPLCSAVSVSIAALIAWGKTRFKHFCNFVGTDGCAEFKCNGGLRNITEKRLFCFKDAWAVLTSTTRHLRARRLGRGTVYAGTSFDFSWYRPEGGKVAYKIAGRHSANLETPPLENPYNFARAGWGESKPAAKPI